MLHTYNSTSNQHLGTNFAFNFWIHNERWGLLGFQTVKDIILTVKNISPYITVDNYKKENNIIYLELFSHHAKQAIFVSLFLVLG